VNLENSPGAWHGIAEGHTYLPDAERLQIALKACDLYLARVENLEGEIERLEKSQCHHDTGDDPNRDPDWYIAQRAQDAMFHRTGEGFLS